MTSARDALGMFTRNSRGERRVSPSVYKVLLTSHIGVSGAWLGASFAKLVLGIVAVIASVPETSRSLITATEVLNILYPPLAIGTIVSGVLLSLGTRWGLLQHYWIVTKMVLTVGVIVTGIQLTGRLAQQFLAASSTATETFPSAAMLPASLLLALAVAHVLMLATATVLSVYKPWGTLSFAALGRLWAARGRIALKSA